MELTNCAVQQVKNECSRYNIINGKGLVSNLQNEAMVKKNGQPLCLRKGKIKDEQGKIMLVLFNALHKSMIWRKAHAMNLEILSCKNL